jgi:hypothetical protein
MTKIYKYELQPEIEIDLPTNSEVLSVANQNEDIFMWVAVTENKAIKKRKFVVFPTGKIFDSERKLKFIGTVLLNNGNFVFHVFEEIV